MDHRYRLLLAGATALVALLSAAVSCVGWQIPDSGGLPGTPGGTPLPRPEGLGSPRFDEQLPEGSRDELGFPSTELWEPGPIQPSDPVDFPALGQSKLAIVRGLPALPSLPRAELEGVAFLEGKPVAAVSRDGHIFLPTATGGWVARATRMALQDVFAQKDPRTGAIQLFVVGNFGRLLVSRDGGQSWVQQELPTPSHLNAIAPCLGMDGTPNAWVAVGENGEVLRSRNGADWTRQRVTQVSLGLNAVAFPTPETGAAVGEGNATVSAACCGEVWEAARTPEIGGLAIHGVTFTGRTGWAVGERGLVMRTTDGGLNWTLQSLDQLFLIRFAVAISPTTAFFFGATLGEIAVTTDGGQTIVPYPFPMSLHEGQELCSELQELARTVPGGRLPPEVLEQASDLRNELLGVSEVELNQIEEAKLLQYAAWVHPYAVLASLRELMAGAALPEGSPARVLVPASVATNPEAMGVMVQTLEGLVRQRDGDAVSANARDVMTAFWRKPALPARARPQ